ncbi:MAG: hypothetical protein CMN13_09855 [Roseobacter sp.]|jgi:integrase/recombinase XerD|uniref:Phage integrase, N-terminal SAM-like domain n=1 Tax=Sulfitobacter pontiacus TaxID=60137 RepID=A0AAX3AFQ7_9RHOB|nr:MULTISPECIES: hypothetical protein [Sulfitobacter]MAB17680.1 hypothetical protein [Roseobacter sp.]HBU53889.1 hypothetical protein [Sulfitobacter sp.]MBG64110.1 hypothetical protein [Roseobacter sp.]MBQ07466.1 hypothetical protein [Roseobacter sp.]UOA24566.1 hypothetical protein DSM110277_03012 [Sulfitobacter pontiacus]|tara:strand:- start:152 stop:379 length:228 start_codon:yes stop_codon:yes gene_type:complete
MSDQYVPALRQRFLEDMQIKGLQPKTQTMYLRGMRDFLLFKLNAPVLREPKNYRTPPNGQYQAPVFAVSSDCLAR